MFNIGFGLLLANILHFLLIFAVVFFVVVPFVMGLVDGKGYTHNVKLVCDAFAWVLRLGFKKRAS